MEKTIRKMQNEMKRFKSANKKLTKKFDEVVLKMKPDNNATLKDMKRQLSNMKRQMSRFKKNNQKIQLKFDDIIKQNIPNEVKQFDFKIVVFKRIDENEVNEYPTRLVIKHDDEHYVARKSMSVTTTESVKAFVNKKTTDRNVNWNTLIDILKTDDTFSDYYENFIAYTYSSYNCKELYRDGDKR